MSKVSLIPLRMY